MSPSQVSCQLLDRALLQHSATSMGPSEELSSQCLFEAGAHVLLAMQDAARRGIDSRTLPTHSSYGRSCQERHTDRSNGDYCPMAGLSLTSTLLQQQVML